MLKPLMKVLFIACLVCKPYAFSADSSISKLINVTDYSAVGDGNYQDGTGTPNAGFFEDAIKKLSTTGGTALYIPPGIYKIDKPLVIPDGVSVYGSGPWSSILFCDNSFEGALITVKGKTGYPTHISKLGILAKEGGAFKATGFLSEKNGVFISDVWINGFNIGLSINQGATDNFLNNFAVEMCNTGLRINECNNNVSNGTLYDCYQNGIQISNASSVEAGCVIISDVRSISCGEKGIYLSNAKQVSISNTSANHVNSDRFRQAGLYIENSTDVQISNWKASITSPNGTNCNYGIYARNTTNLSIQNSTNQGFLHGIYSENGIRITINGGMQIKNRQCGIKILGGDQVVINSVQASYNGNEQSPGYGLNLVNSFAYANFLISNNMCVQDGGGPQECGIYAEIPSNPISPGFININGNTARYNKNANITAGGPNKQNVICSNNF